MPRIDRGYVSNSTGGDKLLWKRSLLLFLCGRLIPLLECVVSCEEGSELVEAFRDG